MGKSMILTTKTKYALEAVNYLIDNYNGKPLKLREIAKNLNIPLIYLEQIFSKLNKTGFVKSTKGKGGGFSPGSNINNATILDFVNILENKKDMSKCIKEPESCNKSKNCKLRLIFIKVDKKIKDLLSSYRIKEARETR